MRKIFISVLGMFLSLVTLFQASQALFEETVKVAGTSFTIGESAGGGETPSGNTALKMYKNLAGTSSETNLTDSVQGSVFDNITPEWTNQVGLKVFNKGTQALALIGNVDYINDPDVLRDDLYVKIVGWNDNDNDGIVDTGEEGTQYGYDTILRLRNDLWSLGNIAPNETRGFVMKFDGTGLTDTNIGMTAVYDFLITGSAQ